jgi:hypothetical protein
MLWYLAFKFPGSGRTPPRRGRCATVAPGVWPSRCRIAEARQRGWAQSFSSQPSRASQRVLGLLPSHPGAAAARADGELSANWTDDACPQLGLAGRALVPFLFEVLVRFCEMHRISMARPSGKGSKASENAFLHMPPPKGQPAMHAGLARPMRRLWLPGTPLRSAWRKGKSVFLRHRPASTASEAASTGRPVRQVWRSPAAGIKDWRCCEG